MKLNLDIKLISMLVITCLIGFIAVMTFVSARRYTAGFDEKQTEKIVDVIRRASIQCYALEGNYPPSLKYLTEHYGFILDEERFVYFYDNPGVGNMLPDIVVQPRLKR